MSDTPRTDAFEFFIGSSPEEGEMVVNSADARTLERELNALCLALTVERETVAKLENHIELCSRSGRV